MKLQYGAKMRLLSFLLLICVLSFACSSVAIDKNVVSEEEKVEYNANVTVPDEPDITEDIVDNKVENKVEEVSEAVDEAVDDVVDEPAHAEESVPKENASKENAPKERSRSQSTKIADKTIRKFVKNLEKTTDIPTICVYTADNTEVVSREQYVDCNVYTLNCDEKYKLIGNEAGIRVRGNSTAYGGSKALIRNNQVPYRIKFVRKTNMFGLNDGAECKSWVLVKAEYDLLKNDIAFRLGRTILHEDNYCSDGIPVHVYINGTFKGVYELCEQSQVNKNRIDIPETPKDYTGTDIGYLVEIDNYGEKPCFSVNYAKALVTDEAGVTKTFKTKFYSVKNDVYSDAQTQYIKKYVNNVFNVLYEACEKGNYYFLDKNNDLTEAKKKKLKVKNEDGSLKDPAEVVAESVIDLDSVVDLYLVYEITKDRDVGEGSFYMYADLSAESTDHRLTFTCPWDFEWAYEGSYKGLYAGVFNTESFVEVYEERSNPWFVLLLKQDWFKERVRKRWEELRYPDPFTKTDQISQVITEERELLNKYSKDLSRQGSNACKKAEALITWTENRIKWLDGWLMND